MASDIQKMKKNLLSEDHPLYEKIIAENPIWWQFINRDNDFYVEIRKGNVIDVYYRGGRVAQISCKKGAFVATAHVHLSLEGSIRCEHEDCRRLYREEPNLRSCPL